MKTCRRFLVIMLIVALLVPAIANALADDDTGLIVIPQTQDVAQVEGDNTTNGDGPENDFDGLDGGEGLHDGDVGSGNGAGDKEGANTETAGGSSAVIPNDGIESSPIELSFTPLFGTEAHVGEPLEITALVPYEATDSIGFLFEEANVVYEETLHDTIPNDTISNDTIELPDGVGELDALEAPQEPEANDNLGLAEDPLEFPNPAFREFITYYTPEEAGMLTITAFYYAIDSAGENSVQKIEASLMVDVKESNETNESLAEGASEDAPMGISMFGAVQMAAAVLEVDPTIVIQQECIGLVQGKHVYKLTVTVTGPNGAAVPAGTKLTVERGGGGSINVAVDSNGVVVFFEEVSVNSPADRTITVYVTANQGYNSYKRASVYLAPVMVEATVASVVKDIDSRMLTARVVTDSADDLTNDLWIQVTFYNENNNLHSVNNRVPAASITSLGGGAYEVAFELPQGAYYAQARVVETAGIRASIDLLNGYWQAAKSRMQLSILERFRDLSGEKARVRAAVSGIDNYLSGHPVPSGPSDNGTLSASGFLVALNASDLTNWNAAATNVCEFPVEVNWSGWTSGQLPYIEVVYLDYLGNHMPCRERIEFKSDDPLDPIHDQYYDSADDYTNVLNLNIVFTRGIDDELHVCAYFDAPPTIVAKVGSMDLNDPQYNTPQPHDDTPILNDKYYSTAVSQAPNARIEFRDKDGKLLTITNPLTKTNFADGEEIKTTLYLSDFPNNDTIYAQVVSDRYTYTKKTFECTSEVPPYWTETQEKFHYEYGSARAVYQLKQLALKVEIEQVLDHIMSFTVERWDGFTKPVTLTVLDDRDLPLASLVPYKHKFFDSATTAIEETWYPLPYQIGKLTYFDTIMKNMDGDRYYTFILSSERDEFNDIGVGEVKQEIYIEKIATMMTLEKDPDNLNNLIATVSMNDGGDSHGVPQFGRIRVTSSTGGEWFYPYDPETGVCIFAIPEATFDLTVQYVNKTGKKPEEVNPYGPYANSPKSYWAKRMRIDLIVEPVGTPEAPYEYDISATITDWNETINGAFVPTLPPNGSIEFMLNGVFLITLPVRIVRNDEDSFGNVTYSTVGPHRYAAPDATNFIIARYAGSDYPPSKSPAVYLEGPYPYTAADPLMKAANALRDNPLQLSDASGADRLATSLLIRRSSAVSKMRELFETYRIYSRDAYGQVITTYELAELPVTDDQVITIRSEETQGVYCYTFAFEMLANLYESHPDGSFRIITPEFEVTLPFATAPTIPNLDAFCAENGLKKSELTFTIEFECVRSEDSSIAECRLVALLTDAYGGEMPFAPEDDFKVPLTLITPAAGNANIERIDEETGDFLPLQWEMADDGSVVITIKQRRTMFFATER